MNSPRLTKMVKTGWKPMCLALLVFHLWVSPASAKMAWLEVEIVRTKPGQWSYITNDVTRLKSDAELADYFMKLPLIMDAHLLSIHSAQSVPVEQIIKILEMAKKNPNAGIEMGKIECGP